MATRRLETDSQCPICYSDFFGVNEHQLPCSHTCCITCVQKMTLGNENRSDNLACPLCRSPFHVPDDLIQISDSESCIKKYRAKIEKSSDSSLQLAGKIMGMAILDDALFVCCRNKPEVIFKYELELPFIGPPSEIPVSEVVWPRGMAANDSQRCLYITDWVKIFGGRLFRLEYREDGYSPPACAVASLDQQPFGVSYSSVTNYILVTCATPVNVFRKGGSLHIFQDLGEDFRKLRVVEIPDVEIPRHTVFTPGYRYVTCHGWTVSKHGVTSFKQNQLQQQLLSREEFYNGVGENEMSRPLSMNLDGNGSILVVNYGNNRIDLLTENLTFVRHLITATEHNVSQPRQVCLHPSTGRMFVGQEDGQIHIFDALID